MASGLSMTAPRERTSKQKLEELLQRICSLVFVEDSDVSLNIEKESRIFMAGFDNRSSLLQYAKIHTEL